MLSQNFISELEKELNHPIIDWTSVSGGDISEAYKLTTDKRSYFLKVNSSPRALNMFITEKLALDEIHSTHAIETPKVFSCEKIENSAYILMEYIETRGANKQDLEKLGSQLAKLHSCSSDHFGWASDNYIGSLNQSNKKHLHWTNFYVFERLLPQIKKAINNGMLDKNKIPTETKLVDSCSEFFGNVTPALLHGDLWSGNYVISTNGTPYLIDPATYYGDALVDIAMSKLFGGFGQTFYQAYHHVFTKSSIYNVKIEVYQLYYLLVHLNLFGSSYHNSVVSILNRYF